MTPDLPRVAAVRPELAEAIAAHYQELARGLDPALVELCLSGVPRMLAGEAVRSEGVDLTEVERDCLALAEQFVHSAQGVSDEQVAAVSRHLEPGKVLALLVLVSLIERGVRLENYLSGLEVG